MISKARIKFIKSLQNKKVRDEERLFVIEGDKLITEFLIAKVPIKMLLGKPEFLQGPRAVRRQRAGPRAGHHRGYRDCQGRLHP